MDMWTVGEFCRLPTADRPLRAAEFDQLFHDQIAVPRRLDAQRVEFTFDGADDLYDQVTDLVARETACCSFFDFSITQHAAEGAAESAVVLRVGVPESRRDVLDALTNRAAAAWAELRQTHG